MKKFQIGLLALACSLALGACGSTKETHTTTTEKTTIQPTSSTTTTQTVRSY